MILLRRPTKPSTTASCFSSIAKAPFVVFRLQNRNVCRIASQNRHPKLSHHYGLSTKRPRYFASLSKSIIVPDGATINSSSILAALQLTEDPTSTPHTEAVFLVTPRLASLFERDNDFLSKAMAAIYGNCTASSECTPSLSSVVAVVDKIPGRWLIDEDRVESCEGVSLMMTGPSHSHSLRSKESSPESSLSIEIIPLPPTKGQPSFESIVCKFPLANTLFINGQSATMIRTTWKPREQHSSEQDLPLDPIAVERLTNYTLPLNRQASPHSIIPLIPLTSPRPIQNAMGNIVSEILVDTKPMPASTELESAVMASIRSSPKECAVEPRTRIYALIRRSDFPSTPLSPAEFMTAILSGAGLYQVIGGGGGWGKKRGLLALDPAGITSNTNTAQSPRYVPVLEEDAGPTPPGMHSSLVRRSDTIQFFQLKHNGIKSGPRNHTGEAQLSMADTLRHIISSTPQDTDTEHLLIGTVPISDTLDSFPTPNSPDGQPSASCSESLTVYPALFGALSERPIEIEVHQQPPGEDGTSASASAGSGPGKALMNVPYSYFSV